MVDILDRVRNKALQSKIVTPEEAADFIKPGMTLATSGFTSSAYPKAVPLALADRMKKDPFTVNIMTGASTGPEFDEALASVHGIKKRLPFQTDKVLRSQINDGTVDYIDIHLSEVAQLSRCGYLGHLDVAVIEACAITEEGNIIPTTAVGNSASFVQTADTVIIEVNNAQPLEFEGMHDVYLPRRTVCPSRSCASTTASARRTSRARRTRSATSCRATSRTTRARSRRSTRRRSRWPT